MIAFCGCSSFNPAREPATSGRKAISFTSYEFFQKALTESLNKNGQFYDHVQGAFDGTNWRDTVTRDGFETIEITAVMVENAESVRIFCKVKDDGMKLQTQLFGCIRVGAQEERIPTMTIPDRMLQIIRM